MGTREKKVTLKGVRNEWKEKGGVEKERREKKGVRGTSCHHIYITNSLLETDLQNFISHNNFEMC